MMNTQSAPNSILLVDDQPENLQPIVYYLEQYKYKIFVSLSGESAMGILQQVIPDLILLDIMMPGINGYETCRRIKADPKLSDIPVLFMSAVTDIPNKVKGFEVGCQDYITKPIEHEELLARVKTHIQMRHMQKELFKFEKLQALGVLAGGIAHDFNNILSIILGNVQLLKESQENASLIRSTEKAVMRAANLSKSLITFSKGGTPLLKKGDIYEVVKESLDFILDTSDATYELDVRDEISSAIFFDQVQISQAFNQIILNADQAMNHNGTIYARIMNVSFGNNEKRLLQKGDYVCVSISDTGYGIDHSDMKRIFDPYFSTQERGTQKGMGLGLSIAHSIIEQHKGTIEVESIPGKGSSFHVYLPVFDINEESLPLLKREETAHLENDDITLTNIRILIMDDETEICEMLKKILKRDGFLVNSTMDGLSAVKEYQKQYNKGEPYDAVILDLSVKRGMGGVETIKRIINIDKNAKAIISSGYSQNPVMSDFSKYGFKGALFKPYHIDELKRTLHRVIFE